MTLPIDAGEKAFINLPYADTYEERLLALTAGLALYGYIPTAGCVAGEGVTRLDRLIGEISRCAVSVHDLTLMSIDSPLGLSRLEWMMPSAAVGLNLRSDVGPTPRFNMPFELGLAVAIANQRKTRYVVFDTVPFRLDKALSDLRGVDAEVFDGTPEGLFRALGNAFYQRTEFQPTGEQFTAVMIEMRAEVTRLKVVEGYTSLFAAKPFDRLRMCAAATANSIRDAMMMQRAFGAMKFPL